MPTMQWAGKLQRNHIKLVKSEDVVRMREISDDYISIPKADWTLNPLLAVIPMQLLAYHVADSLGLDVDQPRNLAKSVTVE